MAKREINIFSVSFLDLLSGALGAVIILYIIMPRLTAEEVDLLEDVKVLQEQAQTVDELLEDLENSIPKEVFAEIEDELNALKEEIDALQANIDALAGKLERVEAELAKCERKVSELEARIEELESEVASLEEEVKASELALAESEEENERLAEEMRDLEVENGELQAEVGDLTAENGQLRRDIGTMRETDALADNLDLVIVMDLTGSLKEEIADLKENLSSLVEILEKTVVSLRIGFVAFRDTRDRYDAGAFDAIVGNYVTKQYPLQALSKTRLQSFINSLEAEGGGDEPEAVSLGLSEAVAMDWRPGLSKKIIVVIGDASAHNVTGCYSMASTFTTTGPSSKLSTISAGGGETFFRTLAARGQGDYVENQGKMLASILLTIME